ncbi:MAG: hypothetical protein V4574_19955 [Pseudomonadota bacterium]
MSYREGGYRRSGWIGAVVAIVLVAWFFGPSLNRAGERARVSTPEGFETEMLSDPKNAPMLKPMKETHPEEMRAFAEQGAQHIREGATPDQMTAYNRQFLMGASRRQIERLARAPHPDLVAVTQASARVMEKLRATNVATCGAFAAAGMLDTEGLASDLRQAVNDLNATRWRAAAAGRDHPQAPPAQVTAADAQALAAGMRQDGLGESDVQLFLNSDDVTGAPPKSQCDIAYHMYRVMLTLPEGPGDRLMRWTFGP